MNSVGNYIYLFLCVLIIFISLFFNVGYDLCALV